MKITVGGLIALLLLCAFPGPGLPADPTVVGSVPIEGAAGVFVSGSLAYVACNDGAKVVDIGNPRAPAIVMDIDDVDIEDLSVSGSYGYAVSMFDRRMYITEISDPQDPMVLSSVDFAQEPQSIFVSGRYAYVVTAFRVGNGLFVFDVADPRNPVQVGSMLCDFAQDLSCSTPLDIYVSGDRVYLADFGSGIVIVDISDPARPVVVGKVEKNGTNTPGSDSLCPNGVHVTGSLAYVTDNNGNCLRVLDISNPDAPVPLGSVVIPSSWGGAPEHVFVSGSYAYVTHYEGLFVFDISGATAAPVADAAPSVGISVNQSRYEPGDAMAVTLTTTPGTGGGEWDVYVGLLPPDGSLYFLTYEPSLSLGAAVPACPLGPITARTETIFSLTIPAGLPPGDWAWAAVLVRHDWGAFSQISRAPFSIPAAAGTEGATGLWTGTWSSSDHGVSGTFATDILEQGSALTGTIDVPFAGLQNAALTGSVDGTRITFGDISGVITFTGDIDGDGSSGTYVYRPMEDTGTWQATRSQ